MLTSLTQYAFNLAHVVTYTRYSGRVERWAYNVLIFVADLLEDALWKKGFREPLIVSHASTRRIKCLPTVFKALRRRNPERRRAAREDEKLHASAGFITAVWRSFYILS